jgi:hypothetical protein
MDTREIYDQVMGIVNASIVDHDIEEAMKRLNALGGSATVHEMFAACWGLGTIVKKALEKAADAQGAPRDSMWHLETLTPDADDDPHRTFAMRFLVARANDDEDMCMALFATAVNADAEDFTQSIHALFADGCAMIYTLMHQADAPSPGDITRGQG